jgi:hypothetical protein
MKTVWGIFALFLVIGPAISYFRYERQLQPATSAGQHYAIVDETLWSHARPDLQDLRLYSAGKEIPYAVTIETGNSETEQQMLRILQPATIGGKTQFLLDMASAVEYDRVQLKLAAQNFVARARVEGQDDLHGKEWATLGTTTLYDLTDEALGRNSTLQIPLSAYRYLRVTVDAPIKPSEVESATASATRADKAQWRDVGGRPTKQQRGKDTVFIFEVPRGVPSERVIFSLDPGQSNFRRDVEIIAENEQKVGAGEISRVHMQRNGRKIDVEESSILLRLSGTGKVSILVHNGDDAPLMVAGLRLQQYERRIYFDLELGAVPQLYYGDEKLDTPVYDYRKLFQKDVNSGNLSFGAEILNAAYTGRPDERPWSERHPAVLWAAIFAAVLILGGLAFRSVKSAIS